MTGSEFFSSGVIAGFAIGILACIGFALLFAQREEYDP